MLRDKEMQVNNLVPSLNICGTIIMLLNLCMFSASKILYEHGLLPGAAYKELLRQLKCECSSDVEYHLKLSN